MESGHNFVDHYALLQVHPDCDAKVLEKAYRHFAHTFHPDHPDTADVDRFQLVIEAYKVLRDPASRARYDELYDHQIGNGRASTPAGPDHRIDEEAAVLDAEMHQKLLFTLYQRRRDHADDPGLMMYYVQEAMDCKDASFEFHVWYLKSKGLIERTAEGSLAITVEGVDHVIATSRASEAQKLLLAKSADADGNARDAEKDAP